MPKIIATTFIVLVVSAASVLACNMGEPDNMCKDGQVFDPQKGECRDTITQADEARRAPEIFATDETRGTHPEFLVQCGEQQQQGQTS